MKKTLIFAFFISIFLVLMSCGTTETVADSIANDMNTAGKSNQEQTPSETEKNSTAEFFPQTADIDSEKPELSEYENQNTPPENSEKVSDEDSILTKDIENAPTTDEKEKVSEYQIFEEPEVSVFDLPVEESAEEPKETEISQSQPENDIPKEKQEEIKTENNEFPALAYEAEETKNETSPDDEILKEVSLENGKKIEENQVEPSDTQEELAVETESEETKTEEITPSRSVTLKINQYLDVTYPGTGWVYIGETQRQPVFNYFGRKLGTGNTTFALRAKAAGKTLLHFYKNDLLTGEYIDDYLEVIVENSKANGRVKAPVYADIIPSRPQRRLERENQNLLQNQSSPISQETSPETKETNSIKQDESITAIQTESEKNNKTEATQNNIPNKKDSADVKTVIQTSEDTSEINETKAFNYTPVSSATKQESKSDDIQMEPSVIAENENAAIDESLLEKAKKDFEAKQYAQALAEAQQYYNNATTRLDEALYLLGQIWESESEIKNIRSSIDSYDSLTKLFPLSNLWKKAKNRSIYLKRFYIDIR